MGDVRWLCWRLVREDPPIYLGEVWATTRPLAVRVAREKWPGLNPGTIDVQSAASYEVGRYVRGEHHER